MPRVARGGRSRYTHALSENIVSSATTSYDEEHGGDRHGVYADHTGVCINYKQRTQILACRPGVVHRGRAGAGRGTPPAAPPGRRRCAAVSDGFRHGTRASKLACNLPRSFNVITVF